MKYVRTFLDHHGFNLCMNYQQNYLNQLTFVKVYLSVSKVFD